MGTHLNVTEWMKGHVGFGATDYAAGEKQGIAANTTFDHEVLIQMVDIERFVSEPNHSAPMDGSVVWLGSKQPFRAGEFNMLVDSTDDKVKLMFYRIPFTDAAGKPFTMLGHKSLRDDAGHDVWDDITTLFIRIYDGHDVGRDFTRPSSSVPEWPEGAIALGIIHISLRDGFTSALSFEAPGAGFIKKVQAVTKFLRFYGTRIVDLYLRPIRLRLVGAAILVLALVAGGLVLALR